MKHTEMRSSNARMLASTRKDAFINIVDRMERIKGTLKLDQIRRSALCSNVVLPLDALQIQGPFCNVGLSKLIFDSYCSLETGDTKVVYAHSLKGKTTACARLVRNLGLAYPDQCRRLMFTGYGGDIPYLDYLASVLDVEDPNDVVAYIVKALEKEQEDSPTSVLVLDEMNTRGFRDCNIFFVANLMRYIYNRWGIIVYVVTRNKEVADALCALNDYQKIGPLEGLTQPPRSVARCMGSANYGSAPIQWIDMNWKREEIRELLEKTFPDFDDSSEGWFVEGMTPIHALQVQRKIRNTFQPDGKL